MFAETFVWHTLLYRSYALELEEVKMWIWRLVGQKEIEIFKGAEKELIKLIEKRKIKFQGNVFRHNMPEN